ncbi:MAG: META domain-containing protein [Chitinophagales bacterium]|nr:META domain-containing protein [Chitinophagales bacterium]
MKPFLFFLIAVSFASCSTTSKMTRTLTANDWQLYSLDNTLFKVGEGMQIPTLSFDAEKMTVSGNTGCNSLSGPVEVNGDKISFGSLATTRMACPGDNPETKFLEALNKTKKFSIYENKLVLKDADDKQVMVLEPKLR